jgi:cold shock CspA family protein
MSELTKKSGMIVQWFENRGFGWIQATNGKNYFFHITEWSDEADQPPKIGQKVGFESVVVEKGAKAVNVVPSSIADASHAGADALKVGL